MFQDYALSFGTLVLILRFATKYVPFFEALYCEILERKEFFHISQHFLCLLGEVIAKIMQFFFTLALMCYNGQMLR